MSDDTPTKRPVPASLQGHGFKPGISGNPGGRPKGYERRLREVVDSMKADDPVIDPEGVTGEDGTPAKIPAFEAIVKQAVIDAIAGDRYARDFIADRLMGKAKQTVAISEDGASGPEADWSAVPIDKRRELLETLLLIAPAEGDDAVEH